MGNCVSSSGEKVKQSEDEGTCKLCRGVWSTGACTCYSLGSCSCPRNAAPLTSCVFYSPRIQGLLEGHRTEFDTARDHWTMLDPVSEAEAERIGEENRKYFDEVLVNHPEWGAFFRRYGDVEISNEKIGEGGQAEIFKASSQRYKDRYGNGEQLVAKVWKVGVSLKDLERQWPPQMLSKGVRDQFDDWPFKNIKGAAFIRDGEFRNRTLSLGPPQRRSLKDWKGFGRLLVIRTQSITQLYSSSGGHFPGCCTCIPHGNDTSTLLLSDRSYLLQRVKKFTFCSEHQGLVASFNVCSVARAQQFLRYKEFTSPNAP